MGSEGLFRREEWAAAYQNTEEYPEGFCLEPEGKIPEALSGTYFRNGPGLFSHGEDKISHPFDGHGLVASIAFSHGKSFFRSRFVRTKEYLQEMKTARVLYKGTFGTLVPGGFLSNLLQVAPRNVANTGVLSTSQKCLAFFEAGQPYCLDPVTLETRGVDLLGGAVKRGAPFSTGWQLLDILLGYVLAVFGIANNLAGGRRLGGEAVCAHPLTDPSSGRHILFSFCLQLGMVLHTFVLLGWQLRLQLPGLVTRLSIRELDEDCHQVAYVQKILPGYCFLHDMGITSSHYVIFQNPVRLRMLPLLLGTLCPAHCIRWTGAAPQVHLFKRPTIAPSAEGKNSPGVQYKGSGSLDEVQVVASSSALPPTAEPHRQPVGSSSRLSDRTQGEGSPEGNSQATGFVFHQANAFELEGGQRVAVDCIRYPSMPDFQQASERGQTFMEAVDPDRQPISQLWRYEVEVATGKLTCRQLSRRAMEFPAINPDFTGKEHRYVYTAAALHPSRNMPQQALAKLDTTTMNLKMWGQGVHYYAGEPVFVPSPTGVAEDDGWLVAICYDATRHTSECIILDAQRMTLVARLPLQHVLPHGLHGAWDATCHLQGTAL